MRPNREITLPSTLLAAAVLFATIQTAAAKPTAKPQGLWVGDEQYFTEFQGKALEQTGIPKSNLTFGSSDYAAPRSMAFDQHNDLWITFGSIDASIDPVLEISYADFARLMAHEPVKPKVLITELGNTGIPFEVPYSIAFDAAGDLWVSTQYGPRIVELTPSQTKKSGSPSPTVTLTAADFTPEAIRFDASNNLWVVQYQQPYNPSSPLQLGRYAPADRAASGPATPSLLLDLPDQMYPMDIAFDSAGNLWAAGSSTYGDEIQMFAAADLTGSGEISPSPAVTIAPSTFGSLPGVHCLDGIDFDHAGNLWVSNEGTCQTKSQVDGFTPSQLSVGGDLTPSIVIEQNTRRTNIFLPGPIRFGPALQ
jgi:sugar lactone lactonase YvrE